MAISSLKDWREVEVWVQFLADISMNIKLCD